MTVVRGGAAIAWRWGPTGTFPSSPTRTQDGAFIGEGFGPGGVRGRAQFAMDFVLVAVGQEGIEQAVGPDEFVDLIGGQDWREAFLPVVMAALDFAFGLRCWGVEQFDAVEVEGMAQLSEGVGVVGVEEGVKVHIEGPAAVRGLGRCGTGNQNGPAGFRRGKGVRQCCNGWHRPKYRAGPVCRTGWEAIGAGWRRIARERRSREPASV